MLNEQGYHRPTYNEILKDKIQMAKELFGEDIEISEQTPLGKFIRIGAKDLALAYEDLEGIYYSRFPNTASGISLDRLCVFAGISRNPATYARLLIRVTGEENTKIEEIKVCSEDGSIIFHNIEPFVIPTSGSIDITVECETSGKVGNITVINKNPVESIAGVDSVTYVKTTIYGENIESDYDLRKRFSVAVEGAGSTNTNAIRASIMRISTVEGVQIISNETSETVDGRPPHSFEVYVQGGENEELAIAKAIFDKKPVGIKTCSTTGHEAIPIKDESGNEHDIYFSYVEGLKVAVTITIKTNTAFEGDADTEVKKAIQNYFDSLNVGDDVIRSAIYGYVYKLNGVIDVPTLTLSTLNGTITAEGNVEGKLWQMATLSNVILTVQTEV